MKGVPSSGTGVEELRREEAIWTLSATWNGLQTELLRNDSRLGSLIILSGAVHTGVEVRRMYSEMNGLTDGVILSVVAHLADKPLVH